MQISRKNTDKKMASRGGTPLRIRIKYMIYREILI